MKDFRTRIVKLVLNYSLRSCDSAHMMDLLSDSDAVQFKVFYLSNIYMGILVHCIYILSL